MPGIQVGSDEGGGTVGFDSLPFEIRREDGRLLKGHASVRLRRVSYYTQDAKRLVAGIAGLWDCPGLVVHRHGSGKPSVTL